MPDDLVTRVHQGRSPGARWTRVGQGLHHDGPDDVSSRLLAWSQVMRSTAAFTHLTAAVIQGWRLPPLPAGVPVWVAQMEAQHASVRRGVKVIRQRFTPPHRTVDGLRVTTPAETIVNTAFDLGVLDVVVLADCALHLGDVSYDELERVAAEHRRGAPKLRLALPLLDGRCESPWESLLRVFHVACGVDVEPQRELWKDGAFVARADLHLVGTHTVHEYDGVVHLTREAQVHDLRRMRRLLDAGIERRGYTSVDLLHHPTAILREADAALGRPHDPSWVGAWYDLLNASLFSSSGTARFCQRLALSRIGDENGGVRTSKAAPNSSLIRERAG
jgi:hypothetical protein